MQSARQGQGQRQRQRVDYVEDVGRYRLYRRPVKRKGPMQLAPGQRQDGYGGQIVTDYVLRMEGETASHRVFSVCWSNAASHYVVVDGMKFFIRTNWSQSEITDEPR